MYDLLHEISSINKLELLTYTRLSGGDINDVYLLSCREGKYVIKLNDALRYPQMFEAEKKGLQLLKTSNSFIIPDVLSNGILQGSSYLLIEYIESGTKALNFWNSFAELLSKLHKQTQDYNGLDHDNYIGSLPQSNKKETLTSDFYINQRLKPQFKIAVESGFNFKNLDVFFSRIESEIPKESPALIHGDLWGGNYMVSKNGLPVLIDPAVSYSIREMDLAMMKLFGGFPNEVYSIYNEIYPLQANWENRTSIWQLYYLLVHLNLFGSGYLNQVSTIIRSYS